MVLKVLCTETEQSRAWHTGLPCGSYFYYNYFLHVKRGWYLWYIHVYSGTRNTKDWQKQTKAKQQTLGVISISLKDAHSISGKKMVTQMITQRNTRW